MFELGCAGRVERRSGLGVEHDERIECHAVRGQHARFGDRHAFAIERRRDRGEETVPIRRVHEHLAAAARRHRLDRDDGRRGVRAREDRARLPRDLLGPMAQEARCRKRGPRALDFGGVRALAHELLERIVPARGDTRLSVRRPFEAGAQRIARRHVEIGEQLILPRVPELRIGAGDVGDRQEIKMIEPLDVLDLHREAMHDVGIGDVLALRGNAHDQVPAHEPRDEVDIGIGEPELGAERARLFLAEHRVIAAPALGDVVEHRSEQQQLGLVESAPDRGRDRKFRARGGIAETRDIAQHAQRVLVDRVDMEEVVLHASDHAPERRQQRGEHAVTVHRGERADRRGAAPQQREE